MLNYWTISIIKFNMKSAEQVVTVRNYKLPHHQGYYTGPMVAGQPHGKGVINSFKTTTDDDAFNEETRKWKNGDSFEGIFVNGVRSGFGIKKNQDGSWFEGEYKDGVPNGKGTYFWADGATYVGEFINGQYSGYGGTICTKL